MTCPKCGYVMSVFEKECPRCEQLKKQALTKPTPPATDALPDRIHCTQCGEANAPAARFCVRCGSEISAAIHAPVPATTVATQQQTAAPSPAQMTQSVNVSVNVAQRQDGSSGWLVALLILLFGTPMGCLVIPLLFGFSCVFASVVIYLAPMIAAGIACAIIWSIKMPKFQPKKPTATLIALGAGVAANALWIWLILGGGLATSITPASRPSTQTLRVGPSFNEVDAVMDDRRSHQWTEAQREAYWNSVKGTLVTWSGEVTDVQLDSGGKMYLKCNSQTYTSDVTVYLNGSQVNLLPQIRKGQRVTVQGVLSDHSFTGYRLTEARIVGQ